ncbi:GFA family protein [Rhodopila sp.]|uniref:GFA family protein n=1 Tax=Rhodopila sp. TaxID=2480087 RepID=UPI002CC19FF6|nr:GFA family protein [Rhodopila sp.]HVZ07826.1 GFA family protein [Rhodopila sp.]
MAQPYAGGCACGEVRYRMQVEPLIVHCCHCKDCQRQTGTAFVLNALVETAQVRRESGTIRLVGMPTDSGLPHNVARCTGCGTALWSHYGGREFLSFIRVGTLDDPAALPPGVHIYTRSKLPWIALPPDVPAFEAYYDSRTVWSEASLARRQALFG